MIIKVRAWHITQNKMYSPEELAKDQITLLPTGEFINVSGDSTGKSIVLQCMVPLFYTTLNDKNKTEIYDGDILKDESGWLSDMGGNADTALVGFNHGGWMVGRNKDRPHFMNTYLWICADKLEKIGNVYENPELLKK